MQWIVAHIRWVMPIAGVLTCTMAYAAVAPQAALRGTFGETLEGPLADLVVRNWAMLITLIGAMLIYGAYRPAVRPLVLVVAGASKLAFIALVLSHGGRYLGQPVGIAIAADLVMVGLFAAYLAGAHRAGQPKA
jgi:hypothetical protein